MVTFILFVFGAAIGSFLDVVASRYEPDQFLFSSKAIGGRSYCPGCKTTLRWYELIPLVSWAVQRGKCRTCHDAISPEYPAVELVSGLMFVFVPRAVVSVLPAISNGILLQAVWVAAFEAFLLMTLIDLRLQLIPDELVAGIGFLGLGATALQAPGFFSAQSSFLGPLAFLFGLRGNIWVNHIAGAVILGVFFLLLFLLTRGRGMGFGDVKLAAALGLLFGWPDAAAIAGIAFIIGGAFGACLILFGKKTMKSAVPFGPFLALAALLLFFFGGPLAGAYAAFLAR